MILQTDNLPLRSFTCYANINRRFLSESFVDISMTS